MKPFNATGKQFAWRAVGLLWVVFFLNYMDRQIVFSMFPLLKRDLAFTDTQLGLLGSLFTWTYSLCMPLTGRLSDMLPRKWLVIASLVLWSGAMVGTASSNSVGAFLFWRILMGVVESLYIPAAYGLIANLHPGATRSRAFAVHQTAQLAGIIGGGWFGGWSGESIGWRSGYLMLGAVGICYAMLLVPAFGRLASAPRDRAGSRAKPPAVLQSVTYRYLLMATFFFSLILWLSYAWLPNHVYERHHLSLAESGLIATVFIQVSSAVGVLAGGYLADRLSASYPRIKCLIVAAGDLLSGPLVWATFTAPSLFGMKSAAIAYGSCSGLHVGSIFPAASKVVDPADHGFAAGLLNLSGGLAGGAGMLLAGRVKATLGLPWLAGVAGLACSVAGIVLAVHTVKASARRRGKDAAASV
jgi:MFS transporter, Spinster family, sphingosine-1-phosphate transporter